MKTTPRGVPREHPRVDPAWVSRAGSARRVRASASPTEIHNSATRWPLPTGILMIVFSAWRPGRAVLPGWPGSPAAGRLPGGPAIAGPGSVSGGAWLLPPPVAVLDLAPVPHTFVPGAAAGQGLRAASVRGVLLPRDSSWANVACGMLATTDRLRLPWSSRPYCGQLRGVRGSPRQPQRGPGPRRAGRHRQPCSPAHLDRRVPCRHQLSPETTSSN